MEGNFYLQILKLDEDPDLSLYDIVTNCIGAVNAFCVKEKIPLSHMKELYEDALRHYHWMEENST